MLQKDINTLTNWVKGRASLRSVEEVSRYGLVENERFTENARRAYRLIWGWSAVRLSGPYGTWQDRVFDRWGASFVDRRIQRCNELVRKLMAGQVSP